MTYPEMVNLPVIREEYCSQEQTDAICKHLWSFLSNQDGNIIGYHVGAFIGAALGMDEAPDDHFQLQCLQEQADHISLYIDGRYDGTAPALPLKVSNLSRLGILDVMFEFDRRIRHIYECKPLEPNIPELCRDPSGSYPELKTIQHLQDSKVFSPSIQKSNEERYRGIDRDLVKTVVRDFYKTHPQICYEMIENIRKFELCAPIAIYCREKIKRFFLDREDYQKFMNEYLRSGGMTKTSEETEMLFENMVRTALSSAVIAVLVPNEPSHKKN